MTSNGRGDLYETMMVIGDEVTCVLVESFNLRIASLLDTLYY